QRVLVDRQWAVGTTAAEYLADLRSALRHPGAQLVIYDRRGGPIAATVTPVDAGLPPARRGHRWLPFLLVVYSAERGIMVTGYQISGLAEVSIPAGVRWLK